MPRWIRKILVFCGVVIKLSVAVLVLYLLWLIYVVIYEEFFLTYLPVIEPYLDSTSVVTAFACTLSCVVG